MSHTLQPQARKRTTRAIIAFAATIPQRSLGRAAAPAGALLEKRKSRSLPASLSLLLLVLAFAPLACHAGEEDYYDFRGTLPGGIGAPAATAATAEPTAAASAVSAEASTTEEVTAFQQAVLTWQQQQQQQQQRQRASNVTSSTVAAAASEFVRVEGVHFMVRELELRRITS